MKNTKIPNEEDKQRAFQRWWLRHFPEEEFDLSVIPFLHREIRPRMGWLKAARIALIRSTAQSAKDAGISQSAWSKFEQAEEEGKITIASLSKLAEAMDCELVYALRPKRRVRFSKLIWEQLLPIAEASAWVRHAPDQNKFGAIAKVASDRFQSSDFRKARNWAVRKRKVPTSASRYPESV